MTASYDAGNHIAQFNTTPYSYDPNGNLLTDGQRNYTWDAANRLTQLNGISSASFQYDAYGRRTSKTINGTQTGYLYDGINPVQEQTGSSVIANLLNGGVDEHFARTTANGSQSYLTDALGSTLALSDANGNLTTQYSYEAYGNTTASGTTSDNAYQYTGRENDGTGLYYYRARYYDTQSSRFISQDPIGFGGGVNQYTYVEGNPIGKIDPSGLKPVDDYLNDWVCGSKGWEEALDTARNQKMRGFDPSDPMDADNRTAAEHYIFGRYLGSGGAGAAAATAYLATGAYWGFGYQGAKMAGLYPNASPPSYAQLYWEEKAYTDAISLTRTFSGSPGKCGCDAGKQR